MAFDLWKDADSLKFNFFGWLGLDLHPPQSLSSTMYEFSFLKLKKLNDTRKLYNFDEKRNVKKKT